MFAPFIFIDKGCYTNDEAKAAKKSQPGGWRFVAVSMNQ
jgi:hypothetical protein